MTVESNVADVHDGEDECGESDKDGPEGDEEVRQGGVDDGRIASYVFQDVKPVPLNNDGYKTQVSVLHAREKMGRQTHKESCSRLEGPMQ